MTSSFDNHDPSAGVFADRRSFLDPRNDVTARAADEADDHRARGIYLVVGIGLFASVLALSLKAWTYYQTGAWQAVLSIAGTGIAMCCLVYAARQLLNDRIRSAGFFTIFSPLIACVFAEASFSGVTPLVVTSGTALVLSAGLTILPNRMLVPVVLTVLTVVSVFAVHAFVPFQRLDPSVSPPLTFYLSAVAVFSVAALLWLGFRVYWLNGTIRSRLVVAFVLLVLLPAGAVSVNSILVGLESGKRQCIEQLESVAVLKEGEIKTWARNLEIDLLALAEEDTYRSATALLSGRIQPDRIPEERRKLRERFEQVIGLTKRFDEMFLLSRDGTVVLSTNPAKEGEYRGLQDYFRHGLEASGVHVQTVAYSAASEELNTVMAVNPVTDRDNRVLGVMCGRARSSRLNVTMVERTGLGESGETYLVAQNFVLMTPSRFPGYGVNKTFVRNSAVRAAIQDHKAGYGFYEGYRGGLVVGVYRWVPELGVALLAERDGAEALRPLLTTLRLNGVVALTAVILAVAASLVFTRGLTTRLRSLADTATRVAAGELGLTAHIGRDDEIGSLAKAFNTMTEQLRDVIERLRDRVDRLRRTEAALSASEEKYRSIVENALDGIYQTTPHGSFVSANPATARILGYDSPDELIGTVTNLAGQVYADPERRDQFLRLIKEEGKAEAFEARLRRKDGGTIWCSLHARAIHDANGRLCLIEGLLQDITARRRAEEERRESEEKLRQQSEFLREVLESLTHPFYVIDAATYHILMSNSAARASYAASGSTCYALIHCQDEPCRSPDHPCPVEEVKKTGKSVMVEHVHHDRDGNPSTIEVHAYPLFDADGKVARIIEYAFDVTDRRLLEERLSQSAKMEAIGRLAGGVAHDFNNLLTAMIGYTDILLRQMSEDDRYREKIVHINRAAERAANLTGQLLAFSRKQVLEVRVLDLNSAIGGFQEILGRLMGEDVEVVSYLDPNLGMTRCDPNQIEQILMNLAVNARDAMPDGGRLTIETANVTLDSEYAKGHPEVTPGPHVMFAVSDTGFGMDPETRSQVFEPFFTTKEKGKGTGLGLATVFGIVKQHQGHISVYSEPGMGTTFKIYLPLVRMDNGETPVEEPPEASLGSAGRGTVLVVEDEEIVRDLACEVLEMLGYSVLAAGSPEEAVRICQECDGDIDLLLTDVVLPRMDGRSLYNLLSEGSPRLKVLYMSGYTGNFIVRHGVLYPGVHFIQKPFTVERLAEKVKEALEDSRKSRG